MSAAIARPVPGHVRAGLAVWQVSNACLVVCLLALGLAPLIMAFDRFVVRDGGAGTILSQVFLGLAFSPALAALVYVASRVWRALDDRTRQVVGGETRVSRLVYASLAASLATAAAAAVTAYQAALPPPFLWLFLVTGTVPVIGFLLLTTHASRRRLVGTDDGHRAESTT